MMINLLLLVAMTSLVTAFQAIPTAALSTTRSFVTTTIGSPVNRRSSTVDVASIMHHSTSTLPVVFSLSSSSAPRRGRSSSSSSSSLGLFHARFSSNSSSTTKSAISSSTSSRSQTETKRQTFQSIITKIRRYVAILLASLTLVLFSSIDSGSSGSWRGVAPAHAASTATAITSSSSTISTTLRRMNPFRTRTADELIDSYVQRRLFVDDIYDPVESAYREVIADYSAGNNGGSSYPTLLTEMATSVVGRDRAIITTTSSSSAKAAMGGSIVDGGSMGRRDGITRTIMKFSDVLQAKLRLSASASYIILATSGLVGVLFVPAMLGVLYQSIQRMQIDKGEMKMYGKISE